MAELKIRDDSFLPKDGDFYEVVGPLTREDIKKINLFPRKSTLILENTKGVTSNLIDQIISPNIFFSVRGGYDYFRKKKYQNDEYIKRTMLSPKGLREVIKYYERIESVIDDSLTENQKSMIVYDSIVKDFIYNDDYESALGSKITARGLNGILYKKAVCAGFGIIFKEGLDRLEIENVFQNKAHHHDWVLVKIDDVYRGLEITWECSNKVKNDVCEFNNYGLDKDFYSDQDHNLQVEVWDGASEIDGITYKTEDEEEIYDVQPFDIDRLRHDYQVIKNRINKRKIDNKPAFKSQDEELKLLPIDLVRYKYEKGAQEEYKYYLLCEFLKKQGIIDDNKYPFVSARRGYVGDVVGNTTYMNSFNGLDIDARSLRDCTFDIRGNYNTPYGYKFSTINETSTKTTDEMSLKSVFNTLKQKKEKYAKEYLEKLIRDAYFMVDNLDRLEKMEIQKDHNLELRETDLYTKLHALIVSKELIESYGLYDDHTKKKLEYIKKYFDSKKTLLTQEEIKANDIDFYTAVFEDMDEVRRICEQHEGKEFTDEEWKEKFHDVDYIMSIFDTKDTPRETIEEVLENIYREHFKK